MNFIKGSHWRRWNSTILAFTSAFFGFKNQTIGWRKGNQKLMQHCDALGGSKWVFSQQKQRLCLFKPSSKTSPQFANTQQVHVAQFAGPDVSNSAERRHSRQEEENRDRLFHWLLFLNWYLKQIRLCMLIPPHVLICMCAFGFAVHSVNN